jgi:hypothetical protein
MNARPLILRAFAIVASLALAAPAAFAQSKTGTTLGQFLLIEPSARITGFGNAGTSVMSGLEGAYYNPAAAARLERFEFVFSHAEWMADIGYDYAAFGVPMGRWGNSFVSITALGSGDIDVRTVQQPLGTGERYSVQDFAIGLGYAKDITDRFSVGGQITWMQETIWHSSVGATTVNIGTLYRVAENGLRIGAALNNFGTQGTYDGTDLRILYDNDPSRFGDNGQLPGLRFTDPFAMPVLFRVGLGMPVQLGPAQKLELAIDAFHPSDNTESVSFGTEWSYRQLLALRAGYQNLFLEDSEMGLTLGAGLAGQMDPYRYRFDYAWADQGRLGSSHRFSLGINF